MLPALVIGFFISVLVPQEPRPTCATWADCREQAHAAAAAEDYERFHDLAWLAVQKGRRNDPELMLLLARAQSLSGRPLDALVMLRRLADMGVATDAATSDDFRRVRALPAWEEFERTSAGLPRLQSAEAGAAPDAAPKETPAPAVPRTPSPSPAAPPASPATPAAPAGRGAELLRFHAADFTPAGLAYDRVSRRFIVGDRAGQRLAVVDEFSHQVSTLAGAKGAGFGTLAALEIEAQDGTLWVVSNADDAGRLHKLQLISARALRTFEAPGDDGSRFVDVALAPQGALLVLDALARRVLRVRPGAAALQPAASLGEHQPISIAPASAGVAYVSHESGLLRVDLASGQASPVDAAAGLSLRGIVRLRWHDRSLVGLQQTAGGHRAVRLRLSRDGRSVAALEILDDEVDTADPTATTVVGDTLYYLAPAGEIGMIVRQVMLKR
jgi:hypothetical protein